MTYDLLGSFRSRCVNVIRKPISAFITNFFRHSSVSRTFVCGMIGPISSPTNVCSEVCGRDQLSCHAGHQEASRCWTRGWTIVFPQPSLLVTELHMNPLIPGWAHEQENWEGILGLAHLTANTGNQQHEGASCSCKTSCPVHIYTHQI